MAFYEILSTDVGAPSLTGQNGSFGNVCDFIATAVGWTTYYTSGNERIYIMSNGDYMYLNHDSAVSGNARLSVVRFAEGVTAPSTLVDPFPTVALVANNACNWFLSNTADATARPWFAFVDTTLHMFYFWVDGTTSGGITGGGEWAAPTSLLPLDSYSSVFTTRNSTTTSSSTAQPMSHFGVFNGYSSTVAYWKRSRDGLVKSSRAFFGPASANTNPAVPSGPAYPHPIDGTLLMERVFVADAYATGSTAGSGAQPKRIYMPRLWVGMHSGSYTGAVNGELFTNSAYDPTSNAFRLFLGQSSSGLTGGWVMQRAGTWSLPGL